MTLDQVGNLQARIMQGFEKNYWLKIIDPEITVVSQAITEK